MIMKRVFFLIAILFLCNNRLFSEEPNTEKFKAGCEGFCHTDKVKPIADIQKDPVDWVNPLIDTVNSRWIYFSSACRPFGMVDLCPDTNIKSPSEGWWCGYLYNTGTICAFSHIHEWQMSGIPVMPTTGELKATQGPDVYKSKFSHDTEIVHPGYHSVILDDYNIKVELTSTDRVGFHRYTFLKSAKTTNILFHLGVEELGPCDIFDATAKKVNDTEIEGCVVMDKTWRRPKYIPVYFVAQFDKPFESFNGWLKDEVRNNINDISGKGSGIFVTFSVAEDEVIQLKVAISYVSIEQARLNLQTELPHWDFDKIHKESREIWNNWLSKIEVTGGTSEQKIKFYTDLWHALLGRGIFSDVNGKYVEVVYRKDMTAPETKVHQIPLDADGKPKYQHYTSDGFWGSQWSLNILWGLAYPDMLNEWCNVLVDIYKNSGLIPRGPCAGNSSFVMIGSPLTPLIVGSYMKGIRDFDVEKAYEGIRKNAFPGGAMAFGRYEQDTAQGGGIDEYIRLGYVPIDRKATGWVAEAASATLEYAYQDWCAAQMAKALGKENDYKMFMKRSENYKNVYDTNTGFMRPKNTDGSWMEPFNPMYGKGFTESDAWQYTWFVPHDIQGLVNLMGSRENFVKKLNSGFEEAQTYGFAVSEKGGVTEEYSFGTINYTNQPCTHTAHLFNYAGSPWLSQKWVRQVKEQTFGQTTPFAGYFDDEDQGQMGALGVLMAIGLFQVKGGCELEPIYEITSPIFDKVVIHLDEKYYPGKKFVIVIRNNSSENKYIQSAILDGEPLNKCWFYHKDLIDGGTLILELGPKPNKNWGSKPEDAPPSETPIG